MRVEEPDDYNEEELDNVKRRRMDIRQTNRQNFEEQTAYQRLQKTQRDLKDKYTIIEKDRVKNDFMYMMLSGKDPKERRNHLEALVRMLKQTFSQDAITNGLDTVQMMKLDEVLNSDDPDLLDCLWFLSFRYTNSLLDWFKYGEPAARKAPPPIKNIEMFEHFIKSESFNEFCTSLKDGKMSFKSLAIALRSEYAITVGFKTNKN